MIAALVTLSTTIALAGQSTVSIPVQPPRDTSAPIAKGSASIKGKVVTAEGGRPIRRVQVSLGSSELTESKSMSTNAQGVFEFTELPAGRYTVTANRAGYLRLQFGQKRPGESGRPINLADKQQLTNIDFALPRTSAIVGRVTDEVGDPLPNASIFPMQWKYFRGKRSLVPVPGGGPFNRTDDTGGYRITGLEPGDYFVMATTREAWTHEKDPKERIGFLPTYAPGTHAPTEAMRVKVGLGQEITVPDFPMVPGRVGIISGTAVSSSGTPLVGESVEMMQEFAGPGASSSFGAAGAKVTADGSFTIRNVTPGDYKVTIRRTGDKDRPAEAAATTVSMFGDDVSGVTLITSPGGTVKGRVVTDDGSPLPADQKMRVTSRPIDASRTYTRYDAETGRVQDDMTFELAGVFGASRFGVTSVPTGWTLKAVDYDGKDLADTPTDVGSGISGVTIVLSKTMPKVQGTLLDEKGQPAEGAVIMFPDDPAKWLEESRLTASTRPDNRGAFEFRNVVAGAYLLVPVEYVRQGDWADPQFLENLRPRATPVRVEEAGAPSVALVLRRQ